MHSHLEGLDGIEVGAIPDADMGAISSGHMAPVLRHLDAGHHPACLQRAHGLGLPQVPNPTARQIRQNRA